MRRSWDRVPPSWNVSCWWTIRIWRLRNIRNSLCSLSAPGVLLMSVIVPTAKPLLSGASWHRLIRIVLGPKLSPILTIRWTFRLLLERLAIVDILATPPVLRSLPTPLTICLVLMPHGSLATMTLCP